MILSLKKTLALVLVVALLAGIAVYAFRLSLPQAGPRVTITSLPLEFSMELDKTEFQLGENITVGFILKNVGNETITVFRAYSYYYYDMVGNFDFSITDENGTTVYQWTDARLHDGMIRNFNMTAGEQINQAYIWDQRYYIKPAWSMSHVPVGTYTIRGVFYAFSISNLEVPWNALETPSITFEIK